MSGVKLHSINLEGYKALFDTLYPPLCLFASKYLGDMDISKDIVQEVFIRVWEKNPKLKNYNAIKGYFYNAVKNGCLDYLKSKPNTATKYVSPEHLIQIQTEDYYLSNITTAETYKQLHKAIETLPEKMGKVIKLSLNNFTTKDIAEELSITPSTVRTQKIVALQKLKKVLGNLHLFIANF